MPRSTSERNEHVVHVLNDLIHLDYDAIHAYRAAIDRLEDAEARRKLGEFLRDHERHVDVLQRCVRDLGGRPVDRADFKRVLTQGKVFIGSLKGDDGILAAMRANEEVTNTKYENALKTEGLSAGIRRVLEENLADERRHRAWLIQRLGQESPAPV